MNLVASEQYEDMALTYQCIEIQRLIEILKKNGISDQAVRREICEDYIFDAGVFLDQYWLKSGEIRVFP